MQKFDAIVIGTGQAGPPLAARLVDAQGSVHGVAAGYAHPPAVSELLPTMMGELTPL